MIYIPLTLSVWRQFWIIVSLKTTTNSIKEFLRHFAWNQSIVQQTKPPTVYVKEPILF